MIDILLSGEIKEGCVTRPGVDCENHPGCECRGGDHELLRPAPQEAPVLGQAEDAQTAVLLQVSVLSLLGHRGPPEL